MMMVRLPVSLAAALLLTVAVEIASAETGALSVCAGQEGGSYQRIAVKADAFWPEGTQGLAAIETMGSLDSLSKLAEGRCKAALVHGDALFFKRMMAGPGELDIVAPVHLFDELIHFICRRDAGVAHLMDLLRDPEATNVLVGKPESTSNVTWKNLKELDRRIAAVSTEPLGGAPALAALLSDDQKSCLLHVAGLGAEEIARIDTEGAELRLVPLDIWYLNAAEEMASNVYMTARIPAGIYGNLQRDLGQPEVETVAVGTFLVARKDWAKSNPGAYQALRAAIKAAAAQTS